MKKILIGGGSGLVGSRLTDVLMDHGYEVCHLSRSKEPKSWVNTIYWDVDSQELDPKAIEEFDVIINLAGAGIADEAWTDSRKKEIRDSRVNSNLLIKNTLLQLENKPEFFISASAIGYYGMRTLEREFHEDDAPGTDFLSKTCLDWESSAREVADLGIPTAMVRIGLVLSDEGGALTEIEKPVKWGVGAPLGTGKQYMAWVHVDDLSRIFLHILENKLKGVYNGVSPQAITNKEFTYQLAKTLRKRILLPAVPAFILKMIMGDRAQLVLEGSRVSAKKIQDSGFKFEYEELGAALKDFI